MENLNQEMIDKIKTRLKQKLEDEKIEYSNLIYMKENEKYEFQRLNLDEKVCNLEPFIAPEDCMLVTEQISEYKNGQLIITEIPKFAIPIYYLKDA